MITEKYSADQFESISIAFCSVTCNTNAMCISCGAHQVFRFTAEEVIKRLEDDGYVLVRRDERTDSPGVQSQEKD